VTQRTLTQLTNNQASLIALQALVKKNLRVIPMLLIVLLLHKKVVQTILVSVILANLEIASPLRVETILAVLEVLMTSRNLLTQEMLTLDLESPRSLLLKQLVEVISLSNCS
jgi:hypothetical protein